MIAALADVCCASLPAESLAELAALRAVCSVAVAQVGGRAWVRWEAGDDEVLKAVLPVAGVELYERRNGTWYRHGRHLPAFEFPEEADYRPLYQVLTPLPIRPELPQSLPGERLALRLVADTQPRPATAMRCPREHLARWADTAPSVCLEALQAAGCAGRVILLGAPLPPLAGVDRFWGHGVLVPLGSRPEPLLPADALRAALGVADDELLLLETAGAEAIPMTAFRPLTRASLRLALREARP